MNRTDRLVAMVMYMQGRRVVRAEELAAHFEVTTRTIYRDVAALSEAGVPVAGEAGVGYSLVKSYHLPPVMLTTEEAGALYLGSEMARQFSDASLRAPAQTALDKLRAILPADTRDQLERLAQNTVIVGPATTQPAVATERRWLLTVQQAVVRRQLVIIVYKGKQREESETREIEPLGTVYYTGQWYLVAWCRLRKDFRFFRVDRIVEIVVKPDRFPHRPNFSLTKFLDEMSAGKDMTMAQVRFSNMAMERVRREGSGGVMKERKTSDGTEVTLSTFSLEWLADWLMSFGEEAEALAPDSLRKIISERARSIVRRYERKIVADIRLSGGSGTLAPS